MQNTTSSPIYAVQDVPGRGKGLVAIQRISKGTRILSEEPLITFPEHGLLGELLTSICRQVDTLTEHQRQVFLSMYNIHPYGDTAEQYLGIARTVSLPIGADRGGAGIFLDACRINHACDNNSQKGWNENIQRHTVHALRDIEEGEEITIYYLGAHQNREIRRAALRAKLGFTCMCRLCSLPPEESRESDKRLDKIYQLDDLIGRASLGGILSNPLRTLRYVDQQVRLYNEQGPDDVGLPRAFLDAAQIAIANGDLARGRIFIERAVSGWKISSGDDSSQVIENKILSVDPSKHKLYGLSMNWRAAVDDVPRGLDPSDFEDWLWRREKPPIPGPLANLRRRATFPGFIGLPNENDVDLDFYERKVTGTYGPRRHWCFLAEIVDILMFLRLEMELKDITGRKVPLFFYTDGRGRELELAQVQRGYTVAILYAERHVFVFCEPGIRHEDPGMIKVRQRIAHCQFRWSILAHIF
jgi:hypothetical protein